jgi:hypothetical protein
MRAARLPAVRGRQTLELASAALSSPVVFTFVPTSVLAGNAWKINGFMWNVDAAQGGSFFGGSGAAAEPLVTTAPEHERASLRDAEADSAEGHDEF